SRRRAFVLGWLAGTVACTALVTSSVAEAGTRYFGLAPAAAWGAGVLAAQLYGAVWFGVFAVAVHEIASFRESAPARAAAAIAAAWVACELLRSRVGDGCPWILVAHSQHDAPLLLQVAGLGGAAAVSF